MDINRTEKSVLTDKYGKGAYFAMCNVSLLLVMTTFLSNIFSFEIYTLLDKFSISLQRMVMNVLLVFGAQRQDAYAAAKYVVGSEAFSEVLSIVTSFICLVIPAIVFSKFVKLDKGETFNVSGKCINNLIPIFCLCHLITTFASVFSGMISDFMLPTSADIYNAYTGVSAHTFNLYEFIINILCTCIFVPVVEEYVFRGVVFGYLKRYGVNFAIVASAVVFGIAHASPVQSVYAFVFGVVSALVVAVTGNIKTSIIFHVGNNFITVVLGYAMGEMSDAGFNAVSSLYLMVVSFFGIYGLYALCKKDGILSKIREDNDALEQEELVVKPGMSKIVVFPLAVYIAYYVYSVIATVM